MPLDMLLVNAFHSLTPRKTAEDKQRIIDALTDNRTEIYIPGMRIQKVTVSIDYAVFMFCYPWETNTDFAPHYTRQPLPKNYDQSSTEYGKYSFDLAANYNIDVMVGYWNGASYGKKGDPSNIFNHFRKSISNRMDPLPKIAYSMEFKDPREPFVKKHLEVLWNEEFNLPRYCRLYDRANRWRFPVIFWGVLEVGPPEAQPDAAYITALGDLLTELKQHHTSDGAQAYIIWHSQLLTRYLGTTDPAVQELFKKRVIDQIDAFYQHEMHIPEPSQPLTWFDAGMNGWDKFPHVTMDPARNLDETRSTQDRIKASLQDINKDKHLIASDGFPIPVIPGCMPQYSRERYTYLEHAKKLDTPVKQSRVNCTDTKQLLQTLQSMADLAETNRLIQDGLSWTVRRIVALTSWNEWREGTAWEPCAPDSNNPNIFGITDTDGRFLTQAKKAFATRKLKYTIGDKKRPDPEPGPDPNPIPV